MAELIFFYGFYGTMNVTSSAAQVSVAQVEQLAQDGGDIGTAEVSYEVLCRVHHRVGVTRALSDRPAEVIHLGA